MPREKDNSDTFPLFAAFISENEGPWRVLCAGSDADCLAAVAELKKVTRPTRYVVIGGAGPRAKGERWPKGHQPKACPACRKRGQLVFCRSDCSWGGGLW